MRNTVTGILGVDPNVREAAVAMGMTDRQILWQVEMPLAMSVILTGVRVATVIAVGVTTIAAEVGAGGLGVYIIRGLRQYDNNLLLAGAVPAALMALAADFFAGTTRAAVFDRNDYATSRRRAIVNRIVLAAIGLLIVLLAAYGAWRRSRSDAQSSGGRGTRGSGVEGFHRVGACSLRSWRRCWKRAELSVERKFELGGNLPHDALVAGQIDLYPEYTGTAYTAILKHPPITDPRAVYEQVKKEYAEKFRLAVSEPLGFENTFAILVRGAEARRLGLKTISDAAPHAPRVACRFRTGFHVARRWLSRLQQSLRVEVCGPAARDEFVADLHRAVGRTS